MSAPCVADPEAWDLDQRGPTDWLRSMALCAACPRLEECRTEVLALPRRPQCLVWAGVAYGKDGESLTVQQVIRHRSGWAISRDTTSTPTSSDDSMATTGVDSSGAA